MSTNNSEFQSLPTVLDDPLQAPVKNRDYTLQDGGSGSKQSFNNGADPAPAQPTPEQPAPKPPTPGSDSPGHDSSNPHPTPSEGGSNDMGVNIGSTSDIPQMDINPSGQGKPSFDFGDESGSSTGEGGDTPSGEGGGTPDVDDPQTIGGGASEQPPGNYEVPKEVSRSQAKKTAEYFMDQYCAVFPELVKPAAKFDMDDIDDHIEDGAIHEAFRSTFEECNANVDKHVVISDQERSMIEKPLIDVLMVKGVEVKPEYMLLGAVAMVSLTKYKLAKHLQKSNERILLKAIKQTQRTMATSGQQNGAPRQHEEDDHFEPEAAPAPKKEKTKKSPSKDNGDEPYESLGN